MGSKIIQSIDRALQVLELFTMEKPEWGVTEISQALNLYKSSVHNILSTLEEREFIKKDPISEKYRLGIKFLLLGNIVDQQIDVKQEAIPYIGKLVKEFNETVHLGILDGNEVLSIDQEDSRQSLRSHINVGQRAPLYCTAVGKALLAYQPKDKVSSVIKETGLKRYTENTITDPEELKEELKKIRKQGYAVDNIEHDEGVRCVAAPIRDYTGEVIASLSVSGPASRINEKSIPVIAKRVKEYCQEISKKMGYIT